MADSKRPPSLRPEQLAATAALESAVQATASEVAEAAAVVTAEAAAVVAASEGLARAARRHSKGAMKAVRPTDDSITGKFKALK